MEWLKKSWQIGRFKGVEIRLHISMLLIVPLAYVVSRPKDWMGWIYDLIVVVGFFVCVLLHEIGHTVAAQHFGIQVNRIVLWPMGGLAVLSREPERPLHKLIVRAAGPLANLSIALILGGAWFAISYSALSGREVFSWGGYISHVLLNMTILNAMLAVFNLLPIVPLDGGGILSALTEILFGRSIADTAVVVIGIPLVLGLAVFAFIRHDYILLILCVLFALGLGPRFLSEFALGIAYFLDRPFYYRQIGDFEGLIRMHTRALEKSPRDISHLLRRAIAYAEKTAYGLAQTDIETVLQLEPDHCAALELRGVMRAMNGELDLALNDFTRIKTLKPDWAMAYFNCGGVYLDWKQYDRALNEYNQAIQLAQIPRFFRARSMAHYRLQDFEAAHRDQAEALRLSPQDGLLMSDLNLPAYEGYLDWAQDFYGWVLQKDPKQWQAYQGRGDAYVVNGQPDTAIADYSRALEMAPKEVILYLRRGLAYQKAGRPSQAAEDFRRVLVLTYNKSHFHRRAEQLLQQIAQIS